jgi:hypothetical protein
MPAPDLPAELRPIDEAIDSGDLELARSLLAEAGGGNPVEVLRIKLGLFDGSLAPPIAMQKLIQIMRQDPHVAGGKELYQDASSRAYREGVSSVSHSHPPPPVRGKDPADTE